MMIVKISALAVIVMVLAQIPPVFPGQQHVHHKIYVPAKVRTIYRTKIIKIPEHHHYIREKEKPHIVPVPEHHHYFHEKEKHEEHHDFHKPRDDFELDSNFDHYKYGNSHNLFKKHTSPETNKQYEVYD